MNVIFLDYDGVVNTPCWHKNKKGKWVCTFNFPEDGQVNDEQAVQWISEFCEKYHYHIVVSSTWRFAKNYKECLRNAGLRDSIKIIGRTDDSRYGRRGVEIKKYLIAHQDIDRYIIIDDETYTMLDEQADKIVKCNTTYGFREPEFEKAVLIEQKYEKGFIQNEVKRGKTTS